MENDERHLKGVRREERRRNVRKMRVSGKMTATLNAIRKSVSKTLGKGKGGKGGGP